MGNGMKIDLNTSIDDLVIKGSVVNMSTFDLNDFDEICMHKTYFYI